MNDLFEKIKSAIDVYTEVQEEDSIILNGQKFPIQKNSLKEIKIKDAESNKTVAFIDGGQAELLKAPSFSLQFIRMYTSIWKGKTKTGQKKHEFYLLLAAQGGTDITYKAEIFSKENKRMLDEDDLVMHSMDATIRNGSERADISRVGSVARRFAELAAAAEAATEADHVVLDGNLEQTFTKEENCLSKLPSNCCALAKTANIFTKKGRTATAVLNNIGPETAWQYPITVIDRRRISLVKLYPKTDYVFRFETFGNEDILPILASHSNDPVFLGYPYPLIWTDKCARISNQETAVLRTQFMVKLGKNITKVRKYLNAANAHEVLDNIG